MAFGRRQTRTEQLEQRFVHNAASFSQSDSLKRQARRDRRRAVRGNMAAVESQLANIRSRAEQADGGICASLAMTWLNKKLRINGQGNRANRMEQLDASIDESREGQRHMFATMDAINQRHTGRAGQSNRQAGEAKREIYQRRADQLSLGNGRVLTALSGIGRNGEQLATAIRSNLRVGLVMPHSFRIRFSGGRNIAAEAELLQQFPQLSVGHAVAWYVSKGGMFHKRRVYLFDPNFGEVRDKLSNVEQLVRDYVEYTTVQHESVTYSIDQFSLLGYDRPE